MWFEKNKTIFVSMPGVPFEMKDIMENEILPRLKGQGNYKHILHLTILTQGVPESIMAERLHTWEISLPPAVKLAYLPNPMGLKLRLTATGQDRKEVEDQLESARKGLLPLVADCHYGFDRESLAGVIGKLLTKKQSRLSVAESCTGGNIAHLITLTPGSSQWFTGSVTAYSNETKTGFLDVSPDTLRQFGAVSSQTATEMALGIKKRMNSDYAVATTGIAGPDGGTPEKPVGTIWISVAGPTKFICEKFVLTGDRERFIQRASQTALHMLRKLIVQETGE
jgi:nicotinamide-nucleotide amidase